MLLDQRDVPVTSNSFSALFDDGLEAWLQELPLQGIWQQADFKRIHSELSAIRSLIGMPLMQPVSGKVKF
ncbi:hypothetical protein [Xenorhabdus littoralis]|uniref:hypothetical protein n=1 Tax=Xenorhabdus littoralis TaxID=2582835 RepID=UPI0029E7EE35|nr:hypothetical protein [Xenorhabdus sp. Reich]